MKSNLRIKEHESRQELVPIISQALEHYTIPTPRGLQALSSRALSESSCYLLVYLVESRTSTLKAIVVDDEHIHDFTSWISTYFNGFHPFTSLIKVVSKTETKRLFSKKKTDDISSLPLLANIVLAEYYTVSRGRTISMPNLSHAQSTFGYIASLAALTDEIPIQRLWQDWRGMRNRSAYGPFVGSVEKIVGFWENVAAVVQNRSVDRPNDWPFSLMKIRSNNEAIDIISQNLPSSFRKEISIEVLANGDRHKIVSVFQTLCSNQHNLPTSIVEPLLGFVMANMSKSTYLNPNIPRGLIDESPLAPMWAAALSSLLGLQQEPFSMRISRRIAQCLNSEYNEPFPYVDLSIEEYKTQQDIRGNSRNIFTIHERCMKIGFSNRVTGMHFFSKREGTDRLSDKPQRSHFLKRAVLDLKKATAKIESELNSEQLLEQRDLFGEH